MTEQEAQPTIEEQLQKAYDSGYDDALSENREELYDEGYSAGESSGFDSGYSEGYAEAMTEASSILDRRWEKFKEQFLFEWSRTHDTADVSKEIKDIMFEVDDMIEEIE